MVIKVKDSEDPNKFNMYTVLDPEIKIKNLVMGQKTFLFTKGSSIKDHNNKLEADILLKPKEVRLFLFCFLCIILERKNKQNVWSCYWFIQVEEKGT